MQGFNRKGYLHQLEHEQSWDDAISLMQKTIAENSGDMDAYLAMNYLLMNLLVEKDYDDAKHDYYAQQLKHYFDESYKRFSHIAEYLFFMGITAFMSEWYFDIDIEEARAMVLKARELDPEKILYLWGYYTYLDMSDHDNRMKSQYYAQLIIDQESDVKQLLKSKGALGRYILGLMKSQARS